MKQFTQRQKIFGGFFCIVSVAWSIDMLTGGPTPQLAGAAQSPVLLTTSLELPSAPENIDALIEAVNLRQTAREPLPFTHLARDVFAPSEALKPALDDEVPEDMELAAATAAAESREPEISFESMHKLRGVISGRTPLALIDEQLAPVGAAIDGYRLIQIENDRVTLEKDGRRVVLQVVSVDKKSN